MKSLAIVLAVVSCSIDAAKPSANLRRAAAFLNTQAKVLGSAELTAVAHEAQNDFSAPDGLDGVKQMIRNMLVRKMDEHAELATHASFCNAEMTNSKQKVQDLQQRIEKSKADKDMLEARHAELTDQIAEKQDRMAKAQKAIAKAASIQQQMASEKDASDAQDASFESRVEAKQSSAVKEIELERQVQQLRVENAKGEKDVEYMQRDIIKKNQELAELNGDLRGYAEQLRASDDYAEQISHQCTVPAVSHEERQARRGEEIDNLRQAQSILSGDDIYTGAF